MKKYTKYIAGFIITVMFALNANAQRTTPTTNSSESCNGPWDYNCCKNDPKGCGVFDLKTPTTIELLMHPTVHI